VEGHKALAEAGGNHTAAPVVALLVDVAGSHTAQGQAVDAGGDNLAAVEQGSHRDLLVAEDNHRKDLEEAAAGQVAAVGNVPGYRMPVEDLVVTLVLLAAADSQPAQRSFRSSDSKNHRQKKKAKKKN
jgi:hypothetical protein